MVTSAVPVKCAVEGPTDKAVLQRLLNDVGLPFAEFYGGKGKHHLISRLPKYNRSARFSPWVVLLDLDNSAPCAPGYVESLLPNRQPGLLLRIAVQSVEAWLLGDTERLACFLGVSPNVIPSNPDAERDPKATLVNLARHSRRREVREAMVPDPRSGRSTGPAYVAYVTEFVLGTSAWRPEVAAQTSRSLSHCMASLRALKDTL